jgi:hypothetical protein
MEVCWLILYYTPPFILNIGPTVLLLIHVKIV